MQQFIYERDNLKCARCNNKAYTGQNILRYHNYEPTIAKCRSFICDKCFKCGKCGLKINDNDFYAMTADSNGIYQYRCANCNI